MKKQWLVVFYIFFWCLIRLPFLIHLPYPINADVAVHLQMAFSWFEGGAGKFMWAQNYLGTLETLWNAVWFKIIPHQPACFFVPNAILALICDLLFLKVASKFLSRYALVVLAVLLLFLPPLLFDEQLQPAFSYTTLFILVLLSLLTSNIFFRGFLLGAAFYTQPISIYFVVPLILWNLFCHRLKGFYFLILGLLLPLLFSFLPIFGEGMTLSPMNAGKHYYFASTAKFTFSYLSAFFGYPLDLNHFSRTIIWILGIGIFSLLIISFIQQRNKIRKILENALDADQAFVVFLSAFFIIPFLVIVRKYESFDLEFLKRYLWLWHYPVYFFAALILGKCFEKKRFRVIALFLLSFFSVSSLYQTSLHFDKKNHQQIFENTVQRLQQKNVHFVIGDYWAIYPVVLFGLIEKIPILALPTSNYSTNRKKEWIPEFQKASEVAYLCLRGEVWCDKNPPDQVNASIYSFEKDKDQPSQFFHDGDSSLMIQFFHKKADF